MNIFVLDRDPIFAAQFHCDKHIGKMLIESVQILCTSMRLHWPSKTDWPDYVYKATHVHSPVVRWVYNDPDGCRFGWLRCLASALAYEYRERYERIHLTEQRATAIWPEFDLYRLDHVHWRNKVPSKDFVQNMPEHYRVPGDAVAAYRAYYRGDKVRFAKWEKGRKAPSWWVDKSV